MAGMRSLWGSGFGRTHKDQTELLLYKEKLAQGQKRAEYVNGFLQHNLAYGARRAYLSGRKEDFLRRLGSAGLTTD